MQTLTRVQVRHDENQIPHFAQNEAFLHSEGTNNDEAIFKQILLRLVMDVNSEHWVETLNSPSLHLFWKAFRQNVIRLAKTLFTNIIEAYRFYELQESSYPKPESAASSKVLVEE